MRIAVMEASDDLAAAVTRTGDATVVPPAGEHTVTPLFKAVHVVVEAVDVNMSDIGVAVAAAAGNVLEPRAVIMVRSIFWCWYGDVDL